VSGIPLFVCGLQFRQQVGASLVLAHALAWVLPPLLHARQRTHDQNSEHEISVEFCFFIPFQQERKDIHPEKY
jgi:hypothetical protein